MPTPAQHTNRFRIEVDGAPLPDVVDGKLLSAHVDNAINLPDLFLLVFRDPDREVISAGGFTVGAEVVVKVHDPQNTGGVVLASGEVTALEADIDTQGTLTIVRGLDKSHRLFRGRHTKSYVQMTYAEIAREVAGRVSLEIGTVDPTDLRHDHVTQANTTDWVFLRGLATEVGYDMGVVDGKFVFRKPKHSASAPAEGTLQSTDALELILGANLIRCRASVSAADQVAKVEVRGWDSAAKEAVVARRPLSTDTLTLGTDPAQLASAFGDAVYVSTEVPYAKQAEVDGASDALAEAVACSFAEMDGLARGNPKIKAGTAVSLGLVAEPFDGKYTVTTTRHSFDPDEGYTTAFGVAGGLDRSLAGVITGGSQSWGRPSAGPIPGVVTALVTDARDPDELGRVKVRFPWLSDDFETDWVRIVQAGAGDQRGWAIVPEVGDEVLLAFDQGDVRRPYVIGGLYNGVDRAHDSVTSDWIDGTSGAVNMRSFTSRTGHRLDFADHAGKEQVHLTTGDDGYRVTLDQAGTKITVHSDGSIEIDARNDVKITSSSGNVEISGIKVKVSGSAGVDIDGGPTTNITGQIVKLN